MARSVCVCVCVWVGERERGWRSAQLRDTCDNKRAARVASTAAQTKHIRPGASAPAPRIRGTDTDIYTGHTLLIRTVAGSMKT